jgi:predicted MFS family arabinose efflux permease
MRDLRRLVPMIVIGVVGNSVIYIVPLLVGGMVTDRGFDEQLAGFMVSADLGGYAVATLVAAALVGRVSWQRMALAAVLLMVAANFATTFIHDSVPFAIARVASGMGCGILAALAAVAVGQTEEPDRNYGVLLAVTLLYGTAALWTLPFLIGRFGLSAAYWLIAGCALATLPLIRWLPPRRPAQAAAAPLAGRSRWWLAGLVLGSILLFWASQNDVYAYAERIGAAAGLTPEFIGFSLGAANLTGFVGAALVAFLGTRFGRFWPLVAATVGQVACLGVLMHAVDSTSYLTAIALLALCWNIVNPFQLGILALVDTTGSALALAATVTGVGLAAGPALAAIAVAIGRYAGVLWVAIALAIASLLLLLPALRAGRDGRAVAGSR